MCIKPDFKLHSFKKLDTKTILSTELFRFQWKTVYKQTHLLLKIFILYAYLWYECARLQITKISAECEFSNFRKSSNYSGKIRKVSAKCPWSQLNRDLADPTKAAKSKIICPLTSGEWHNFLSGKALKLWKHRRISWRWVAAR